jgi:hypothetical protein
MHYAGGVLFANVARADIPHSGQSQLLHWQQSAVGTCGVQHLRVRGRKDLLCQSQCVSLGLLSTSSLSCTDHLITGNERRNGTV